MSNPMHDQLGKWAKKFGEPTSLDEARVRRLALIEKMNEINAQLGDKNRAPTGTRMSPYEYHTWRKRAVFAKNMAEKEALYLRLWLNEHSMLAKPPVVDSSLSSETTPDTATLLRLSYCLLRKLVGRVGWNNIQGNEIELIDSIRDHLLHLPQSQELTFQIYPGHLIHGDGRFYFLEPTTGIEPVTNGLRYRGAVRQHLFKNAFTSESLAVELRHR